MKKYSLFLIAIVICLSIACSSTSHYHLSKQLDNDAWTAPETPYGIPDSVNYIVENDMYKKVTYIYNSYKDNYMEVSFVYKPFNDFRTNWIQTTYVTNKR